MGIPGRDRTRHRARVQPALRDRRVLAERELDPAPLVTPPYYVIEVIAAITYTFTGLSIDHQARVLAEDHSPIPGLLAAGADAGGVFHRAYAGGLASALVFGLQAAATATAQRATRA